MNKLTIIFAIALSISTFLFQRNMVVVKESPKLHVSETITANVASSEASAMSDYLTNYTNTSFAGLDESGNIRYVFPKDSDIKKITDKIIAAKERFKQEKTFDICVKDYDPKKPLKQLISSKKDDVDIKGENWKLYETDTITVQESDFLNDFGTIPKPGATVISKNPLKVGNVNIFNRPHAITGYVRGFVNKRLEARSVPTDGGDVVYGAYKFKYPGTGVAVSERNANTIATLSAFGKDVVDGTAKKDAISAMNSDAGSRDANENIIAFAKDLKSVPKLLGGEKVAEGDGWIITEIKEYYVLAFRGNYADASKIKQVRESDARWTINDVWYYAPENIIAINDGKYKCSFTFKTRGGVVIE